MARKEIDDGGMAFPGIETDDAYNDERQMYGRTYSYGGMSLRDYFAAKAMHGILAAALEEPDLSAETLDAGLAKNAYAIADAMIKARKR